MCKFTLEYFYKPKSKDKYMNTSLNTSEVLGYSKNDFSGILRLINWYNGRIRIFPHGGRVAGFP